MQNRVDVAIVGAGIAGLAHAWMAAARGLDVVLLERSAIAQGASVRNFGMIWPIGQPAGDGRAAALRSRELWLSLTHQAGLWVHPCGSLHLAHRDDEWAVLQEYVAQQGKGELDLELLSATETLRRTPAARPDGLLGSMWSSSELCVDPYRAIATIPSWLASEHGVQSHFSTSIVELDGDQVVASDGRTWRAERTIVCSGRDFQTLLPATFAGAGLRQCKLHMMRTAAQANHWRIGPHLASGLTLRHYASFSTCPSLPNLQRRVREETPELDKYGIHVMASQNEQGQVVLGDSHEYDDAITPFDRTEIDALILRELQKQFCLPDWSISGRWHGIYAKHPERMVFEAEPSERTHVFVALGGAGMTLAFGLADAFWNEITGQELSP